MKPFPFLKLAAELRNKIYELVLYESLGFEFNYGHYHFFHIKKSKAQAVIKGQYEPKDTHFLAITRVCRQLRTESLPLFYQINTFTLPVRFGCFGRKMTKAQMSSYGADLKKARKWLKGIGGRNSDALSKFVIDLGTWNLNTSTSFDECEWRTMGRRLERKQLLPMVQRSSILCSIELKFEPNEFYLISGGYPTCSVDTMYGSHRPWRIQFLLPEDQQEAAKVIERTFQEKMREVEAHTFHQGCHVVKWIDRSTEGLKRCRDLMLHTIGIKEKDEGAGEDGAALAEALEGLNVG